MFYFSSKAATLVSRVPCGSLARVLRSLDVKKKRAARSLMCYLLIMIFVIVFYFIYVKVISVKMEQHAMMALLSIHANAALDLKGSYVVITLTIVYQLCVLTMQVV